MNLPRVPALETARAHFSSAVAPMDPQTALQLLLLGVVLPLAASLASTAMCWWTARGILPVGDRRDGLRDRRRAMLAAILSPLAVLVGVQVALFGALTFPPQNALHQIPLMLIAAFVLGLIPALLPRFIPAWAPAAIAFVAGLWWLLFVKTPRHEAFAMASLLWGAGMLLTTPRARPIRGWTLMVPLGFTLAGAAVVLVATGSLKLAQLAGAAAVTLLGSFAVSLTRPRLVIAGPGLSVFVAMLAATLSQGAAFGDTPKWLALAVGIGGPAIADALTRWRFAGASPR